MSKQEHVTRYWQRKYEELHHRVEYIEQKAHKHLAFTSLFGGGLAASVYFQPSYSDIIIPLYILSSLLKIMSFIFLCFTWINCLGAMEVGKVFYTPLQNVTCPTISEYLNEHSFLIKEAKWYKASIDKMIEVGSKKAEMLSAASKDLQHAGLLFLAYVITMQLTLFFSTAIK